MRSHFQKLAIMARFLLFCTSLSLSYIVGSPDLLAQTGPSHSASLDLKQKELVVRVGVYDALPLVGMVDQQASGLFVDLLREIAVRESWQLEFKHGKLADILAQLEAGTIDLVAGLGFNSERSKLFTYSQNPVFIESGIIFSNNMVRLATVFDLKAKKLAYLKGSVFKELFKQYAKSFGVDSVLIEHTSIDSLMHAVSSGAADALISTIALSSEYESKYNLRKTSIVFSPVPVLFAANQSTGATFVQTIDRAIDNLKQREESRYFDILDHWIKPDRARLPDWFAPLLWAALGLALSCITFILLLRYEVRRKTKQLSKANQDLQSSKLEFKAVFNDSPDALAIMNGDKLERINTSMYSLLDLELTRVPIELSIGELVLESDKARIEEFISSNGCSERGHLSIETSIVKNPNHAIAVELKLYPLLSIKKNSFLLMLHDIRDKIESELRLKKSELELKQAQAYAHVGSWVWYIQEDRLSLSDEMFQLFALEKETFTGKLSQIVLERFHPSEIERFKTSELGFPAEEQELSAEYRIVLPDARERVIFAQAGQIEYDNQGKPYRVAGFAQDITERKQAEDRLKTALSDKETLLRELYHRTKNNMYIISSLLSLYRTELDDVRINYAFSEMINRIQSMALVHEKLYQSQNLTEVQLDSYIRDLIELLAQNFAIDNKRISFVIELEKLNASIDQCIPLGLVLNELLTNSFKYAFPDGISGQVTVRLKSLADESLELLIADDGRGVDKDFVPEQSSKLGLQTVCALIRDQLSGTIEFFHETGFSVLITVPQQ